MVERCLQQKDLMQSQNFALFIFQMKVFVLGLDCLSRKIFFLQWTYDWKSSVCLFSLVVWFCSFLFKIIQRWRRVSNKIGKLSKVWRYSNLGMTRCRFNCMLSIYNLHFWVSLLYYKMVWKDLSLNPLSYMCSIKPCPVTAMVHAFPRPQLMNCLFN